MKTHVLSAILLVLTAGCHHHSDEKTGLAWEISVLPSSLRLDPTTNIIIEQRFNAPGTRHTSLDDLLKNNWVYDGSKVTLSAARGEYISFQLVISNHTDDLLRGIKVEMSPFSNGATSLPVSPELFLEWAVEVKTPSTGYPKASLGTGWYPDALIPMDKIQDDSSKVGRRWTYPLWLPDFNNRIEDQKSMMIWVDQFISPDIEQAPHGKYISEISVTIGGKTSTIPVELTIWNFELPNENTFRASLQHEGFLSRMDEELELQTYQLFKRNRISLMDPTYEPGLSISPGGNIVLDWDKFDRRLRKYFTGEAFTKSQGYQHGPGYGEPIETFVLPFDVYGKHGTRGWPDIGGPDVEKLPENAALYINTIHLVSDHLKTMIDPEKTDITIYLNGLDESYFQEALERMVYYGDLFKEHYPEAHFRIDGGYSEEEMAIVGNSIEYWASHTISHNMDKVRKYQEMGIKDWIYGPMLYESKVNSWVGSSTFIDLPLVNDRAISWACWKYKAHSWLSWGAGAYWNRAWYDPETWKDAHKAGAESDAVFTHKKLNGNGQLIYSPGIIPNVDVPCPSIRLKTMRNGVQEYEYMRLLAAIDGNRDRVDDIVNILVNLPFGDGSIGNLDVWSYDAMAWDRARIAMGEMIQEGKK